MPIFEFRCADCGEVFECLSMNSRENLDLSCPKCQCQVLDRVLSRSNYTVRGGAGSAQPQISTKSCGSNQCMTLDLPGHSR